MSEFKQYRRSQIAELRAYVPGECMDDISISAPDKEAGSPKPGDMIARNPKNHADKWLVAAQYFADNFEDASSPDPRLAMAREEMEKIAKDRADWLLDAVACATQDRRFLRGEPEYDEVAGEAILLNAEKAIRVAFDRATLTALEEGK